MISLIGGKLTTAGAVARECTKRIGIAAAEMPGVSVATESSLEELMENATAKIAELAGVSLESARAIYEWYGPRSVEIAERSRSAPKLSEPLCPHTQHIVAEAVDAFENQCAVTLGDVLLRRVPVALGACWSAECSRVAASRIAAAMGWNETGLRAELEMFEVECSTFLQRTSSLPTKK